MMTHPHGKGTDSMKISAMVLISILIFTIPSVFAQTSSDNIDVLAPKLILPDTIYVASKIPIQVNFTVKAIDEVDGEIDAYCDRTSGSYFKVGQTRVRCEAEDSSGNRKTGSFTITVGYEIVKIPSWVKQTTKYWVEDFTDDKTYATTIGFLIQEGIVTVPFAKTPNYSEIEIPSWIKTNAKYWTEGGITNDEYSIMLQWLINRSIIKI